MRDSWVFSSGQAMTILIGDFQPDADSWLVEKAIIEGTEEDFSLKQTETIRVTLP